MGHGKETPRQKMIGLMYLFLTCMLALNVSKDILDAFININNRLNETNANFISKNQIAYDAIFKAYSANPVKVKAVYDYSQLLKRKSDIMKKLDSQIKAYVENFSTQEREMRRMVSVNELFEEQ
ncbi:MAG TPA: hypothetical protein P5243_02935, partial [Bacteroidales bacterium]|nr:hypothetical protein [Bacteroidales bacterium]